MNMKYKDKHTLRTKTKNEERMDLNVSGRTDRRKRKKDLLSFTEKVLPYVIDVYWWESVDESDKEKLLFSWQHRSFLNSKKYSTKTEFKDWIKYELKKVSPNKSIYRDKIIDNILS